MNDPVFAKYGEARKIKYLVTSLDDLKDVVDTVRHMIGRHCEKADFTSLENAITLDAFPIKNSLSAFILGFRLPHTLVEQNYHKPKNP
jgi:hypothetical protein